MEHYPWEELREVHDIDIVVEFKESVDWEIVDLKEFLEDLLGMRVDILTKKAVMSKQLLWKSIEKEIVYV